VSEPLVGVCQRRPAGEGGRREWYGREGGKMARSLSVRWHGHEGWWVGGNEVRRALRVNAETVSLARGWPRIGLRGGGCGLSVANRLRGILIFIYNSNTTLRIAQRSSSPQQGRVRDSPAHRTYVSPPNVRWTPKLLFRPTCVYVVKSINSKL
jgi:hypothetical protein